MFINLKKYAFNIMGVIIVKNKSNFDVNVI